MKPLSLILCALGVIGIFFALSMDTSVATYDGSRVHNIGLVADRETYLITSGILLLVGVILFGFSTLRSTPDQQPTTQNSPISTPAKLLCAGVSLGTCRLIAYIITSSWSESLYGYRWWLTPSDFQLWLTDFLNVDRWWLIPSDFHLWIADFPVSIVYKYLFDLQLRIGEAFVGPIWWAFLPYFIWISAKKLRDRKVPTLEALVFVSSVIIGIIAFFLATFDNKIIGLRILYSTTAIVMLVMAAWAIKLNPLHWLAQLKR